MTSVEYFAEAEKRFGKDQMDWAFVCPVCGYRQTARELEKCGAPANAIAFSCIGRWIPNARKAFGGKGPGPCNYAGGGLFAINPVTLSDRENRYFELAVA